MSISYNWIINPLECYPTSSAGPDYVFVAHWRLNAIEIISGSTYTSETIGVQQITGSSSGSFIPFEQLTEPVVQGWVEDAMGVEKVNAMKDSLAQNIVNQYNPPTVTLQSPWII